MTKHLYETASGTHYSQRAHGAAPRLAVRSLAALATLVLISACSSSPGTHLAYVAAGQNVFAFRISNSSGNALGVVGSPFLAGASPSSVVVLPSKQFAYVANQGEDTIS